MRLSLPVDDLSAYLAAQISTIFPDRHSISAGGVRDFVSAALERVEYCFLRINNKYFRDVNGAHFNHLHTDQYAMFLYFFSNTVHRRGGNSQLAGKAYALNKALHALDAFYEVELPDVFCFQHPVGTVLGRGHYGNFFFVYQRCSVGSNLDGVYPTIGQGVVMYGGSGIIGACSVGENCRLSVNSLLMDMDAPPASIVFGQSPNNNFKRTKRNVVADLFLRGPAT
ncbi:MAG TPA: serine acetyltransferase [Thermoanaerobaculia bacterium]|nr:serine acetyltransferase [Thermoanaerobaculia bacterium]